MFLKRLMILWIFTKKKTIFHIICKSEVSIIKVGSNRKFRHDRIVLSISVFVFFLLVGVKKLQFFMRLINFLSPLIKITSYYYKVFKLLEIGGGWG